jgi:transcriptional regulator with XRE-family HTH domain
MPVSTIHLLSPGALSTTIGRELRRRRLDAGLSQAAVATPYTRALVCAIEHGRALPSLTTLAVLLAHLDVDFDEFFRGVQSQMTVGYNAGHGEAGPHQASRRRR